MSVQLIAVTQPRISNDVIRSMMTPEQFIAYTARVSNPSNQNNNETSEKLLRYCLKNKHFSVFEMVNVVFEVNTTRDIGRQILRHKSCSFQEWSQRYADPSEMGFITREARFQDHKNRQNSIETNDSQLDKTWRAKQEQIIHEIKLAYKWAIENGLAKECARVVLPEGLTMSKLYVNGSLRSWIHYCLLRKAEGTQKEHRIIAQEIWDILTKEFKFLEGVDAIS